MQPAACCEHASDVTSVYGDEPERVLEVLQKVFGIRRLTKKDMQNGQGRNTESLCTGSHSQAGSG
jgi:hypothetical protein